MHLDLSRGAGPCEPSTWPPHPWASGEAELTKGPRSTGSLVRERPGGAGALIRSALSSGFVAPGSDFL